MDRRARAHQRDLGARLAGIPVTHRGVAHEFTVVSGHLPPATRTRWSTGTRRPAARHAGAADGGAEPAGAIAAALVKGGRDATTPVAVVADGTMPGERTVLSTLARSRPTIRRRPSCPPAIVVIGDVVAVAHPERYG